MSKYPRYESQIQTNDDQRYQRQKRKLLPRANFGDKKEFFCDLCDETYYYHGKIGEIECLNCHKGRFPCIQFRRMRIHEAQNAIKIVMPRRPAVSRVDTDLVVDGHRQILVEMAVNEHNWDASNWEDISEDGEADVENDQADIQYETCRDNERFLVGEVSASVAGGSSRVGAAGTFSALFESQKEATGGTAGIREAVENPILSTSIHKIQLDLIKRYDLTSADQRHDIRSEKTLDGDRKQFEDVVQLYGWGLRHCISEEAGDSLLKVLAEIMERHGKSIPLGKTWLAMKKIIRRKSQGLFKTREYTYALDPAFFGTMHPSSRKPFKPVKAFGMDVSHMLAKALLDVNPQTFAMVYKEPSAVDYADIAIDTGGSEGREQGFMSDFSTSKRWKLMCEDALRYRPINGLQPFHVGLNVYKDKSQASESLTEQPVVFSVLNSLGEDYKMIFAGYAPVKLPYSDSVLADILRSRRFVTKKAIKLIIDWQKRLNMLNFMHDLFKELCELGRNCYSFQIGRGQEAIPAVGFVNIVHYGGDTEQLDNQCGCHNASKWRNCRCCVSNRLGYIVIYLMYRSLIFLLVIRLEHIDLPTNVLEISEMIASMNCGFTCSKGFRNECWSFKQAVNGT